MSIFNGANDILNYLKSKTPSNIKKDVKNILNFVNNLNPGVYDKQNYPYQINPALQAQTTFNRTNQLNQSSNNQYQTAPRLSLSDNITANSTPTTTEKSVNPFNIAKDIARAPVRTITSVGLEPTAGILSLIKKKNIEAKFVPKTKIEKMIFGDEPINGI